MTFSILARCQRSGQIGIGAATAVPAVGKLLTHAAAQVGAVATQAKLNPYLGIDGLRLLQQGRAASEVRDILALQDPRAERRQFAVLDRDGRTALWTGSQCLPWAGGRSGESLSVQGNRLTGPQVVDAAFRCFQESADKPLDERLMEALEAGDRAGGDRKGEHSATIYIVDKEEYPLWDIRVDAHVTPFVELRRLHDIFRRSVVPEILGMPTRADPAGRDAEEDA